jgi:hypothetical protein
VSIDWAKAAKAYFDEQPHPRGHGLKIKEVATAVKLASMAKFGGHASLHEASLFWQEFAPGGVPIMAPDEFEHALEHMAPISFAFHGRPPTMKELLMLKDKSPAEVHRHFGDLPDRQHPDVTAANMVKAFQSARPWAREHLGREPVKNEAAYIHHSGESPATYYARLKSQQTPSSDMLPADGVQAQERGNAGEGGVGAAGRQAPGQ